MCLIGLRFGANLAFDYCAQNSEQVKILVLLEPLIDGADHVDYLYRKQRIKDLMTGKSGAELPDTGYENIEGYRTSVNFIEQIKNFNLTKIARESTIRNPISIVQISRASQINPKIAHFAKILEASAEQVFVENVRLSAFWERIPITDYTELTQKILRWCCG